MPIFKKILFSLIAFYLYMYFAISRYIYSRVSWDFLSIFFQVLRRSKTFLPHIARLCLLSTFIEDGFRMWFQWTLQVDFFTSHWGVHYIFGAFFVLVNMLAQGAGCGMVIARKYVQYACGILVFVVVIQVSAFSYVFLRPWLRMALSFDRSSASCGGVVAVHLDSYYPNICFSRRLLFLRPNWLASGFHILFYSQDWSDLCFPFVSIF